MLPCGVGRAVESKAHARALRLELPRFVVIGLGAQPINRTRGRHRAAAIRWPKISCQEFGAALL